MIKLSMSFMVTISIVVGAILLIFWLFKWRGGKAEKYTKPVEEIIPRSRYQRKNITLAESWAFLQEIKDAIKNKFSKKDTEQVNTLGQSLANAGVVYHHVVEYGIRYEYENQRQAGAHKDTQKKMER